MTSVPPTHPPPVDIGTTKAIAREPSPDPEKLSRTSTHTHEGSTTAATTNNIDHGADRIEGLYRVFGKKGKKIWALYLSLAAIAYATSLAGNTLWSYLTFATSSFGKHSLVGSIDVAVYIIGAVGKPFVSKLADLTSRPFAYFISVLFYILGLIVLACAQSIESLAAGQVIYSVGNTGLDMVTSIIIADLTDLQWRGFATALYSTPYIVNAYISGYIVEDVGVDGWRWGYGMFAIIIPVAVAPALVVLFWGDYQARKLAREDKAKTLGPNHVAKRVGWLPYLKDILVKMDAFGLMLLGFAWSLIFLPFTLEAGADRGFKNPSLIAMLVVGCILLITFIVYEKFITIHPVLPMRILNRTFICSCAIDILYNLGGYLHLSYYSSWVYVVTNWTLYEYTIFNNTLGVGLCAFAVIAGLLQRVFHQYKYLQFSGLCIRIIGVALVYHSTNDTSNVVLAWSQILISMGGALSVIGSQVAVQAAVPHADMASSMANLALWAQLGSAVGSSIAASVWTNNMPKNLAKELTPLGLDADAIATLFGSIILARDAEPTVRAGVISAYNTTVRPMYIAATALAVVALIPGMLTTNFYLGKQQNAVDNTIHPQYDHEEETDPTKVGGGAAQ